MIPGLALGGAEPNDQEFPTAGEAQPQVDGIPDTRGVIGASRGLAEATTSQFAELTESGMVLSPPYEPLSLVTWVEESDNLPALIETMAVNASGHGIDYEPLYPKRGPDGKPVQPPPDADEELARLKFFVATSGLEGMAESVDKDRESIGWGTFEVMRDGDGNPAAFAHLPAFQMRLGPLSEPILCSVPARDPTTGEIRTILRYRRFRRFVQIRNDGSVRYFKEWGDPRRLNLKTGKYRPYVVNEATGEVKAQPPWRGPRGGSLEANEVVYSRIYCPYSPYGVPRWVGASGSVTAGRRAIVMVNRWFAEAPIGAKVMALAGGSFGRNALKRLTTRIDQEGRGEMGPFALYSMEAEASAVDPGADVTRPAPPRIVVEDISSPPPVELYAGDDSLIETSGQRVKRTFRLPSVYTGESDDYSRAAADTARACGEEQVLRPYREKNWHRWFREELLPALGVRWWGLKFRGSVTNDDVEAAGGVASLSAEGGATPNQLRAYAARLMKLEQQPAEITEAWGDRPMALTLALLQAGKDPNGDLSDPAPGEAQAAEGAEPVLDADGNPVPGGQAPQEGKGGTLPGGESVQDTALNGAQIASMLEILRGVAEGWLPKASASHALRVSLRIPEPDAKLLVAEIEEGIAEPPPPAPPGAPPGAGGAKPGKGPPAAGGVVGKEPKRVTAKALQALELLRTLELAMRLEETQAAQERDPGAFRTDV